VSVSLCAIACSLCSSCLCCDICLEGVVKRYPNGSDFKMELTFRLNRNGVASLDNAEVSPLQILFESRFQQSFKFPVRLFS
jgi:hypothetical protein